MTERAEDTKPFPDFAEREAAFPQLFLTLRKAGWFPERFGDVSAYLAALKGAGVDTYCDLSALDTLASFCDLRFQSEDSPERWVEFAVADRMASQLADMGYAKFEWCIWQTLGSRWLIPAALTSADLVFLGPQGCAVSLRRDGSSFVRGDSVFRLLHSYLFNEGVEGAERVEVPKTERLEYLVAYFR